VERRGGRHGKAEQRVTLVVDSRRWGTNTVPALAATAIISHFSSLLSSFFLVKIECFCLFEENRETSLACYPLSCVLEHWFPVIQHVAETRSFIGSLSIFKIHIPFHAFTIFIFQVSICIKFDFSYFKIS